MHIGLPKKSVCVFVFGHILRLYVNNMLYACVHFYECSEFLFNDLQISNGLNYKKCLQNLEIVLDIMDLDLTQTKQHVAPNKDSPLAKRQIQKMDEGKLHVSYDYAEIHVGCRSWKYS